MFRNHRIPLTIVLAVLAIVGADIRTANAQNPGFRKFFRERMVPEIEKFRAVLKRLGPDSKELGSGSKESGFELRGFVDWFWRKRVRAEESVREAPKDLVRKLGEVTPSDPALPQPGALVRAQQPFVFEHPLQLEYRAQLDNRAQLVHSFFKDARPQIVTELLKGGVLSERDVAQIFENNVVATAKKSASPRVEFDPAKLKIKFDYSVDIYGIRIKPSEIDLGPFVKKAARVAGRTYLVCVAAKKVNEVAKSPRSDSAKVENCIDSALDLLKDEIRREFKAEPGIGTIAHAPEIVD
jgi:hypothetical protein